MNIGTRIKTQRKQLKLSVDALAEKANLNRTTIYRYENGEISDIPVMNLEKIAKALQTTTAFLMGAPEANDNYHIVSRFNELNEPNKQQTLDFINTKIDEQNRFGWISKSDNLIDFSSHIKETMPKPHLISVPGVVSAGTGEFLLEYDNPTDVVVYGDLPNHYDLALLVNGDSMQPRYENGDVIFVRRTTDIFDGQMIVAFLNGESYLKKISISKRGYALISLNEKYKPIKISEDDEFQIVGVVL